MLACIISSMQSAVIGLCLNRQKATLSLGWNLQLRTIVYSGALATAGTFCLVTWAIAIRARLCPDVLSTVTNFCVHIRSSHTRCRNQTRNVARLSFDHCWVVFLLVG